MSRGEDRFDGGVAGKFGEAFEGVAMEGAIGVCEGDFEQTLDFSGGLRAVEADVFVAGTESGQMDGPGFRKIGIGGWERAEEASEFLGGVWFLPGFLEERDAGGRGFGLLEEELKEASGQSFFESGGGDGI